MIKPKTNTDTKFGLKIGNMLQHITKDMMLDLKLTKFK